MQHKNVDFNVGADISDSEEVDVVFAGKVATKIPGLYEA